MKKFVIPLLVVFAASPALAQEETHRDDGLYGTIGVTQASADVGTVGINVTAITGRIGADFGRYFGAEAEAAIGVVDDDVSDGGTDVSIGLRHAFAAFAVGRLPLGEAFELRARAGYGRVTFGVETDSKSGSVSESDSKGVLAFGLGAQFLFGDRSNGVRAEYTVYDVERAGDIDAFTLSYVRRF